MAWAIPPLPVVPTTINSTICTPGGSCNVQPVTKTIISATTPVTMPAAVVGVLPQLYTTDSNAVVATIDPNGTNHIIYGRSDLGAGVTIVGDGLAYNVLYCECIVAGYWDCYSNSGVWTPGS